MACAGVLFPLLLWSAHRGGQRVKHSVREFQQAMERFSKGARFTLRQMDLIRLQACEARERATQHGHIHDLMHSGRRMAMSYARHGLLQRNLSGLAGILILVVGGAAVAHGSMSLGDLMSFYVAAGLLNGQLDSITASIPELIAGQEVLLKLHGLLYDGAELAYRGTRRIRFDGGIRLRGVDFAHAGQAPVLCGVDFDIGPGERVAIVGANGSGKTTLIGLLVGFYRPQAGRVEAGGLAYDEIDLCDLRAQMGVVMQQQSFFAGSVRDNLGYGHDGAGPEDLQAAARLALADTFIDRLEHGYDTQIGEDGALLSGGERQKLAIARALLGDPRLLILDEPTNHLDVAAIERLMERLATAPGRPAILFISHDPDVVASAGRVYHLERGRLQCRTPAAAAPAGSAAAAS